MKTTLLIISIFGCFSIFAAKTFDIEFRLIDGYTNDPLENCWVTILDDDGTIIYNGLTNKEGTFNAEKIKATRVFIICKHDKSNFFEESFDLINKKKKNKYFKIHMFPTPKYESEMFRIEDSIYGPVIKSEDFDTSYHAPKENLIIDSLDMEARFPNGTGEMQTFIMNNVIYPQESIERNEQGKVYLEFVVETDGFLSHVKISRGAAEKLNNEAKRLVRSMPNWIPGEVESEEKVRTLCRLPINFTLH